MKPGVHFDPHRTASQSPSHTAGRFPYAQATPNQEQISSVYVPKAYSCAPKDPNYRILMRQPRRSDGSYTAPGEHVVMERAPMGIPNGGYLYEKYRNKYRQLKSEPSCFIFDGTNNNSFVRLLADTNDFFLSSNYPPLLQSSINKLKDSWNVEEQKPVYHLMFVAIEPTVDGTRFSAGKPITNLQNSFGMTDCNPVKVPHEQWADLPTRRPEETNLSDTEQKLYSHRIESGRFIADTVNYEIVYITL